MMAERDGRTVFFSSNERNLVRGRRRLLLVDCGGDARRTEAAENALHIGGVGGPRDVGVSEEDGALLRTKNARTNLFCVMRSENRFTQRDTTVAASFHRPSCGYRGGTETRNWILTSGAILSCGRTTSTLSVASATWCAHAHVPRRGSCSCRGPIASPRSILRIGTMRAALHRSRPNAHTRALGRCASSPAARSASARRMWSPRSSARRMAHHRQAPSPSGEV